MTFRRVTFSCYARACRLTEGIMRSNELLVLGLLLVVSLLLAMSLTGSGTWDRLQTSEAKPTSGHSDAYTRGPSSGTMYRNATRPGTTRVHDGASDRGTNPSELSSNSVSSHLRNTSSKRTSPASSSRSKPPGWVLRKPTAQERMLLQTARREDSRFVWNVNETSRHPEEVRHVVFVKVHKAASTTVYNVLLRFSACRRLNVLFPNYGNNILSLYSPEMSALLPHPPSPPFLFDVLVNHVIFNHAALRRYFPGDTRYVAIVREPWSLVRSAFSYFTTVEPNQYLKRAGSFEAYVRNQSKFETQSAIQSLTNNRMSIDLGLPPGQVRNASHVAPFLRHLDRVLDLVLVVERLDESLVLMKRLFRWTLKDILYLKLNSHRHESARPDAWDQRVVQRFRQFEQFDVALYEHFLQALDQRVAQQPPDFQREVEAFVNVNSKVSSFCNASPQNSASSLTIPSTEWSAEFSVSRKECAILKAKELALNSWSQLQQLARLAPDIFT